MNKRNGEKISQVIWDLAFVFGALSLLLIMWRMSAPDKGSRIEASLPEIKYQVKSIDVKAVYEKDLLPVIRIERERNEEARKRALQVIADGFVKYRAGIPEFTEDLEGYGSKFTILGKIVGDKWNQWWNDEEAHDTARYVHDKFEEHIVSGSELKRLLKDSMVEFTSDLVANRNQMLAEMRIRLTANDVPVEIRMSDTEWSAFLTDYQKQLDLKLETYGQDAVTYTILSFAAGNTFSNGVIEIGTEAAKVVTPVIATVGTWLAAGMETACATTATLAGGSTMVCSLGGSAGGSTVGPVGTAVGFTIGMAIGYVVDIYYEKQFEERMMVELTDSLNRLENLVIDGNLDKPGLKRIYTEIITDIEALSRGAALKALDESKRR